MLWVADSAFAAPTCTYGPTPTVFTATAPGGTFTVSADAPVGTLLTEWTAWQSPGTSWNCYFPSGIWGGVTGVAAYSGSTITVNGKSYTVMPTSLAGVGMISELSSVGKRGSTETPAGTGPVALTSKWTAPWGWTSKVVDPIDFGHSTRYAFVKTGQMGSGTASVTGALARVGIAEMPYNDPIRIGQINIAGSATFVVPTCATPNVTVPLGQHPQTKFPSIGSRGRANGETSDFWIDFTRCYTHSASISYTLRPLDGAVAGSVGLMNLSPYSTAKGVGIRIMDRRDYPVAFNTKLPFTMTNGSRYIPLRAAMERTGWQTFAGGSVVGYVDFTMSYD